MKTDYHTRDPLRIGSATILAIVAIIALIVAGHYRVAAGIAIGLLLYAGNMFLLMEIGRSLLRRDEAGGPKPLAALSSIGRMLFLAIALSLTAVLLGREVVLGACGGFLMAQVNLQLTTLWNRRGKR